MRFDGVEEKLNMLYLWIYILHTWEKLTITGRICAMQSWGSKSFPRAAQPSTANRRTESWSETNISKISTMQYISQWRDTHKTRSIKHKMNIVKCIILIIVIPNTFSYTLGRVGIRQTIHMHWFSHQHWIFAKFLENISIYFLLIQ